MKTFQTGNKESKQNGLFVGKLWRGVREHRRSTCHMAQKVHVGSKEWKQKSYIDIHTLNPQSEQ